MSDRLKSAIATVLIHAVLGYALLVGLAMSIPRHVTDKMTLINLAPEGAPPPPQKPPPPPRATSAPPIVTPASSDNLPPEQQDWATLSPVGRLLAVVRTQKWVVEYVRQERMRMVAWRMVMPQGTGGAKVTRLRPPNLTTHTLYWPADWSKGLLPIIAWGNGVDYMCFNNSLPYAAFLGEIASHGYFIVAVGNDDIEWPQPGRATAPDGRPLVTQATALRKAIDWAIAENSRAGSPYEGKLDTGKIAYMGHGCGGGQAMTAAATDPRATTTVLLNAVSRFRPGSSDGYKAPIALFEGWFDDGEVISTGDASFARAQAAGWPMYRAALNGIGHDEAYPKPDPRWTRAVIAWLDWQLKGDSEASTSFRGCGGNCGLWRDGWGRIDATSL